VRWEGGKGERGGKTKVSGDVEVRENERRIIPVN
jgi:hypothetical protein